MILLAALAGAVAAGGLVLFLLELTRREPPDGVPPRQAFNRISAKAQRRGVAAFVIGLVVFAVTRWPVAAIATTAAIIFMPRLAFISSQRQRTAVLEGLEHWVRRLADMLSASRGLEDALELSAKSAPAAIVGPVSVLAARLQARTGTEDALRAFAAEIDDLAGDRIAAALIIASGRRGGAAREVLSALATLLAKDVAARREIEADRAEHRTTVKWIILFVAGFTVFAVLNRSYSAPFGTFLGQFVMGMVALLYAAGFWWLHRLGKIAAPGRFLNTPADRAWPTGDPAGQAGTWRPR
jgi:Flp pilus assembly protein TadB